MPEQVRKSLVVVSIISAALALPAVAQTGAVVAGKGPGVTAAARTVDVTATIAPKGPQGNEFTVTAGPEVKNLAHMKVRDPEQFKLVAKGDQVEATYTEAVAVKVTPAAK
jgi:hypothetical protein